MSNHYVAPRPLADCFMAHRGHFVESRPLADCFIAHRGLRPIVVFRHDAREWRSQLRVQEQGQDICHPEQGKVKVMPSNGQQGRDIGPPDRGKVSATAIAQARATASVRARQGDKC